MHKKIDMNEDITQTSGNITSDDPLVSFLYELIRDHLPAGEVQRIVNNSQATRPTLFCNGWLVKYAEYLAAKLNKKN